MPIVTAPFHDDLDTADWAVLDALTGQIYECALDPARWDDTLTAIVAAFSPLEWDVAFLLWEGNSPPRARMSSPSFPSDRRNHARLASKGPSASSSTYTSSSLSCDWQARASAGWIRAVAFIEE